MLLLPSPVFSLSTCFVTCMGVLSAFMFLCTVPEEVKGYQIPGTRVTAFKIPCACWGLNVGLLEERPGFSTTEASLHPQKPHFNLVFWLCLHSHNDFLLNKQSTPDTVMNTFSTPGTTIGWSYWYMCILDNLIRALFIHSMNSLMSAWTHTMFPSFLCIKVKDPISRGSGRPVLLEVVQNMLNAGLFQILERGKKAVFLMASFGVCVCYIFVFMTLRQFWALYHTFKCFYFILSRCSFAPPYLTTYF